MPETVKLSRTEIALRVRGIIAEQTGEGTSFPESATFDNLDLDSLDAVELVMSIEESFVIDLEVCTPESLGALTVGGLIDLVEGQLSLGSIA